jgi:hypothetical protein
VHYLTTTKEITTVIAETFTLTVDSVSSVIFSSTPLKASTTSQKTHSATSTDPLFSSALSGLKNQDTADQDASTPALGYSNAAYFVNW